MKILLVSPSSDADLISDSLNAAPYLQAEAFFAPHSVVAIAALTPSEHHVTIHDEALHGSVIPLLARDDFDVVGMTLKATQLGRVQAIAQAFRQMNASGALVVGGIGTSYMLPQLVDLVDTAFIGEAEESWPAYLEDLSEGRARALYQRASKPEMTAVPPPRWELIQADIPRYSTAAVQTTRGCHFDCSFCDVIYTFGRKPRIKSPDQVIEEVLTLKRMGVRMIYFADDNFCTNRALTKALLRRLVPLNNSFDEPIGFVTQVDITVAHDEELLALLADCNFNELQIGIESSAPASLGDLNKTANVDVDLIEAIRKIQSYGLIVMAHLIIGADSDDTSAFERTRQFIEEAGIVHHICHPLAAPPGTKLWYALRREGRVLAPRQIEVGRNEMGTSLDALTNIVPKNMTRAELLLGLASFWEGGHDLEDHRRRVFAFLDGIEREPQVAPMAPRVFWQYRSMLAEMVTHHLLEVEPAERRAFFSIVGHAGRLFPTLVPRAIFAHTSFVMERRRALEAARCAREQVAWERDHQHLLVTLPRTTPLPAGVRRQARRIFLPAYHRVRARVDDRETLFQVVLDAMVDYVDRFGEGLEEVDEVQIAHIEASCDRVLDTLEPVESSGDRLPVGRPPQGFVREILDGLDRAYRIREVS